jgi:pyridoxamine 5'-phosphate oxidase
MTPSVAAPPDPIDRFRRLLDAALAVDRTLLPEPTAFSLATVGADGAPSVRILLLKEVSGSGFVFYTNLESRKGVELLARRRAALCFHWQPLEEQVRVEGDASLVSPADADAYFATRARGSQLGAWASRQSAPIEHPGDLERRLAEVEQRFAGVAVPRPPHWSGFVVRPARIEFWRGRTNRLHDRQVYLRDGVGWRVETLYP